METESKTCTIKDFRKDGKGFQSEDGDWFSHFKDKVDSSLNIGDKVEIVYTINGEFKNWTKITKLNGTEPVNAEVVKPFEKKVVCFESLTLKELSDEMNQLNTIASQTFQVKETGKYDALVWTK